MCCSMILGPFQMVIKFLPLLVALTWIMISALYGVEFVLQQSLFLCIYFYLVDLIERLLSEYFQLDRQILSIVNSATLAVLFSNLIGLSMFSKTNSNLTNFMILIYGFSIQVIEPLLMFIELIQVVGFILNFGEKLRSRIFNDENENPKFKLFTLALTLFNYVLIFWSIWNTNYQQELAPFFRISGIIVVLLGISLLVFNLYHEYIVVDASMMALYLVFLHHLVCLEFQMSASNIVSLDKQSPPPSTSWDKPISRQTTTTTPMDSTLFTLASKAELAFAAFRKGFLSLALQMSPLFWIAFILRLKCLTSFFEGHLCKTFLPTFDNDDQDHDGEYGYHGEQSDDHHWIYMLVPSRSALFRLSFVIGFTTVLMQHFTINSWYLLARYQWVVRTLQTYSAPVFYGLAAKAFHHEDWEHDDDGVGFW